jgi:GTP cyclohydrolase I
MPCIDALLARGPRSAARCFGKDCLCGVENVSAEGFAACCVEPGALAAGRPVVDANLHAVVASRSATRERRRITAEQHARFERYLAEILTALGLVLDRSDTRTTPARLLDAWIDATCGYEADPKLVTTFDVEPIDGEAGHDAQVIEGPISFTALCEHHILPFFGEAWVGYVAGERLIGLSKLTRLVRVHSRRFTMQERMGRDIAAALQSIVGARGTAVRIEAAHLCTRMRGVCEPAAITRTTAWRGSYEASATQRREFLELCKSR